MERTRRRLNWINVKMRSEKSISPGACYTTAQYSDSRDKRKRERNAVRREKMEEMKSKKEGEHSTCLPFRMIRTKQTIFPTFILIPMIAIHIKGMAWWRKKEFSRKRQLENSTRMKDGENIRKNSYSAILSDIHLMDQDEGGCWFMRCCRVFQSSRPEQSSAIKAKRA